MKPSSDVAFFIEQQRRGWVRWLRSNLVTQDTYPDDITIGGHTLDQIASD